MSSVPFLAALTALALTAAAALAARLWGGSRSERMLATAAIWLALVLLPIHVLGWLGACGVPHALTRAHLASAIALLSVAAIALGIGRGGTAAMRHGLATVADLVRLPVEGLVECWRARSLAGIGLLAVIAIVLWTAWGSWLAPSSAWDGVFYHEAMIGFAIQNEGFRLDALPEALAPIAGYPRMAESLSLYFVMFLDRRLIEFPGSPMLLVILLGAYAAMRRHLRCRATAIGLASGLALMPGLALQLRSTYIDEIACGFFVLGLVFATRAPLRGRDVVLAAIAIGMVGGSKSTGFLLGPTMAAVLVARVLASVRGVPRALLLCGVAVVTVAAIMGPSYLRNWLEHRNPVWPGRIHYEALGIDWAGPLDVAAHQRSFRDTITMLFDPPIPGQQYHDSRDNGYGNTPPFVVLPLAVLAIVVAIARTVGRWAAGRRPVGGEGQMLVTVLPILATFVLSPAHYWARLNLHSVVVLWIAAAWLAAHAGRALGEGIVGAVVVGGIMTLWWSEPAWDIPLERVRRLGALSPEERAVAADGIITLMPAEVARQRERMTERDVVVFAEHPFPAQLWNERFSNRVIWQGLGERDWIAAAEARGATWVVVPARGALVARLRERQDWEELGPAVREREVVAFRRRAAP